MGLLIEGEWHDRWYDTESNDGRFVRSEAALRNWVTKDGSPGPSGEGGFPAESGRYHLYVSYACPWAHRTLIVRELEGLAPHIGLSVVNWRMLEHGWTFEDGPGVVPDPHHDIQYLHQLYTHCMPTFSGRVTVPVLYDRKRDVIVSNESAEIIRMFDTAFDDIKGKGPELRPPALADEMDRINERVYETVNDGVYRSGFATKQRAYEEAVSALFDSLDWLEGLLAERRYLAGDVLTLSDIRLFTTLLRFDPVYHGHFKCNVRRIVDYPNLWGFTRELYQMPAVKKTVHMNHIKGHYYQSHSSINPTGIVPMGPDLDLDAPHGRG